MFVIIVFMSLLGKSGYIKFGLISLIFLVLIFYLPRINLGFSNNIETYCWGQQDSIISHILYCNRTSTEGISVQDNFDISFDSSMEAFSIGNYKISVLENSSHSVSCSLFPDSDGTMPNDCDWEEHVDVCEQGWCIWKNDNQSNSTICVAEESGFLDCPDDNRTRNCVSVSGDNRENCSYVDFSDSLKDYYWIDWNLLESSEQEDGKFSSVGMNYSPGETKTFRIEWETPIIKTWKGWGSEGSWSINPVGWWNGSWSYRKPVLISNIAENLSGYQVKITDNLSSQYSGGKIKETCVDVRFTYYNSTSENETEIPYWIEECNLSESANATVWINVTYLENNTNTTIYMYYGNPDASNQSNITTIFLKIIDDLQGSWNFDEGNGTAYDKSGNSNSMSFSGSVYGAGRYGNSTNTSSSTDRAISSRASPNITGDVTVDGWVYYISGTYVWILSRGYDGEFEFVVVPISYLGEHYRIYRGGSSPVYRMCGSLPTITNGWTHFAVINNASGNFFFTNGSLTCAAGGSNGAFSGDGLSIGNRADDLNYAPISRIDEVHVFNRSLSESEIHDLNDYRGYATTNYPHKLLMRKYANPEPTYSVGEENQTIIANETEGRASIEEGIANALSDADIYSDQQVYVRYADGSENLSVFDKVAVYGNQTWAFNYVSDGEDFTNMPGLLDIVNVWENQSLTQSQIKLQVSEFINGTKT